MSGAPEQQDLHPNIALLNTIDIRNLDSCADAFAKDAVFHYFNPKALKLQGDYTGIDGIKRFFTTLDTVTDGTFSVRPINAWPVGDELVVVQTKNTLKWDGQITVIDVALVWRFVDGKVAEVFDIPSAYSGVTINPDD